MIINKITEKEEEYLKKKFEAFDKLLENKKGALGYMKKDPTLFAYFFFKDDKGDRFKALPWQDKFLNSIKKRIMLVIARQAGKSTTAGILALHKAYFNPGYTILVVSRTKEQAMELVYRMRRFLNTSRFTIWKELIPNKKENKREIILKSADKNVESRIIVVPATDAALGYSANVVIGDEAARWENGDYIFKEVIEPTTTWTKGSIYLLSTPAGKHGFFYECFNLPEIWEIYHFGWRINPYLTEEYMRQKRKLHTTMSWAINYKAQFVASENSYFTVDEIQNSIHRDAGIGWRGETSCAVGVDFGKVNDNSVIYIGTIINKNDDWNKQIVRVLDRRVKPLGTDYAVVLEELKAINKSIQPNISVLDVTSGEVPSDILRKEGLNVDPFKFTIQSKVEIMNNLKVLMQQHRLQIPNTKPLIEQLEVFEYNISKINQDRVKLHAPIGYHDDEVDALALMCHGLRSATPLSVEFVPIKQKSKIIPNKPRTAINCKICKNFTYSSNPETGECDKCA